METHQIIKRLRLEAGLSQEELARRVGYTDRSSIAKVEAGRVDLTESKILALSEVLGVSPAELMGISGKEEPSPGAPSVPGSKWIPVLGRIQAGIPTDAVQDILDYEEISPNMAIQGEHFALQVRGDSMTPLMDEGDVIIVRQQDDADTGDIAVVVVNGNEATVKKIKKRPEGLMLIPINTTNHEPMFYSNAEIASLPVKIIGKAVELRKKL